MHALLRNGIELFASPRRLFGRIEESTPYAAPLVLLVILLGLCGYARVASGLVFREVTVATEQAAARLERERKSEVSSAQLSKELRELREASVFWNVIASGWSMLSGPVSILGRIFVGAGVLYVVVALSGRRPAYSIVMAVFVYASYTAVAADLLRLYMMLDQQTTEIDTSLAILLRREASVWGPLALGLRAIDPFVVWFWCLVAAGLVITQQLSWIRSVAVCLALGGVDAVGRAGLELAVETFVQRGLVG